MAIIKLPPDFELASPLKCAICGVDLALKNATAGLFDAQGNQAFACVSHYSEVEKLITGWADFMARERRKYLEHIQASDNIIFGEGGCNAWFDT